VLAPEEARALIDSIDITTQAGLRDRALIEFRQHSHHDACSIGPSRSGESYATR
jgi:hypothetical protein